VVVKPSIYRPLGERNAGLAVEVCGRDEGEPELRMKAGGYLDAGARIV
jgi:hypothetical protein